MSNIYEEKSERQKFSRRALLVTAAQLAGLGVLGARAKYLQIDQNVHYSLLAKENRIDTELEPPPRGLIYDSEGLVLADNVPDFRVEIETYKATDPEKVLYELSKIIRLSPERQKEILNSLADAKKLSLNTRINVADHLTWEQFSLVTENLPSLPGLKTKIAQSRVYPYRDLFAHQVGYVGRVSERDLSRMETVHPIYYTPNMAIGKTGIEAKKEDELRGIEGKRLLEKNAHRHVVRELESENPYPGNDLQLTLDAKFQHYALHRLKGESAAAVVIDVETGDVKLLASYPSFDANLFVTGISHTDYNALLNDKYFPLNHKAVQGVYAPASTFKMVTALAALEQGVVGPNDSIQCKGKLNRGRDFYCWKSSGHGGINLKNSLKHSCDVYYYTVSERASIDNISKMARKLGLEQRFDIPQSAVSSGLVPDREWKKKQHDKDWVVGDTFNTGIGQGFLLTTPLQLAVMTARIATGKEIVPNMISSVNGQKVKTEPAADLDINPEHLEWVRQGMYAVCNENRGTAYGSRIDAGGRRWAGKTGTAQVVAISKAEREAGVRRNEDRKWEHRDNALFVAFAPYDKPKYAISVIVEHGGGGSAVAAPIARDLMLYALYGDVPPLTAYPSGRGNAANFWRNVPPLEVLVETNNDEQSSA